MAGNIRSRIDSLSMEQMQQIDLICDHFELRLRHHGRPAIRPFLELAAPELRTTLFRHLLDLDVLFRREQGNKVSAQDYLPEFEEYRAILREVMGSEQFSGARAHAGSHTSHAADSTTTVGVRPTDQEAVDNGDWPINHMIGRYRVIREIGSGGFGAVYLAKDTELTREVAIKIEHQPAANRSVDMQLLEARVAARLDHPNIIPVYDVGRLGSGRLFIVSKLIEGSDLKSRLQFAYTAKEAVELVADVGSALHYAHQHRLFHRDIKPANILIDSNHTPYLTDFGLALRAEEVGTGPAFVGTPVYMSPEQARGEGHLVDARSDVFSLSVVLYELLVGQRPFRGETREDILEQVREAQPQRLTDIKPDLPQELERITLKGLARQAGDRYQTAEEMTVDLQMWLQGRVVERGTDTQHDQIVPKGARSFDEEDAQFYQRLVPGPRTRDGLPEAIQFWLTGIESRSSEKTFRVGVLYGPSGSGKSSFFQAGVLPKLKASVRRVTIKATPNETEADWLYALRKSFPALAREDNLVAAMQAIRSGNVVSSEEKVLLVIDQFEQFLSGRNAFHDAELVDALRQCDGTHVQAVLLVRDDYWYPLTTCLKAADVELNASNSRMSEMFDAQHAKSVLLEFGSSYGCLDGGDANHQESVDFAEEVINEMESAGPIIPVRLALFAEVFRNRDWTKSELARVDGVDGVVSLFLDEIIEGPRANPVLQRDPEATARILTALLPPAGLQIKQRPRRVEDLAQLAGLEDVAASGDILAVLDTEYRLVSPCVTSEEEGGDKEYQLSHDYLVPIVRDWTARKRRDTVRGRAENLLTDRTAVWKIGQSRRNLPTIFEWLVILCLVRRRHWNASARQMMAAASRFYLTATGSALLLVTCFVMGAMYLSRSNHVKQLVEQLATADAEQIPPLMQELRGTPKLTSAAITDYFKANSAGDFNRWALALLNLGTTPKEAVNEIVASVEQVDPLELLVLREQLADVPDIEDQSHPLAKTLWKIALQAERESDAGLRAAGVLAGLQPTSPDWTPLASNLVPQWIDSSTENLLRWRDLFFPVRDHAFDGLMKQYQDERAERHIWTRASEIVAHYYRDQPDRLQTAILAARPSQFRTIMPQLAKHEGAAEMLRSELVASTPARQPPKPHDLPPPVTAAVEAAQGGVGPLSAFCLAAPAESFDRLHEQLSQHGYQLRRYSPFHADEDRLVSAIWLRGETPIRFESGLTAADLEKRDVELAAEGWRPIDVSVCPVTDGQTEFSGIWREGARRASERIVVYRDAMPRSFGVLDPTATSCVSALDVEQASDGAMIYAAIVRNKPRGDSPDRFLARLNLKLEALDQIADPVNFIADLDVAPAPSLESVTRGLESQLEHVRRRLEDAYGNEQTRRAVAYTTANLLYKLDRFQECKETLDELIAQPGVARSWHYRFRAVSCARLGQSQRAKDDLQRYLAMEGSRHWRAYVKVVVHGCTEQVSVDDLKNIVEESEKADFSTAYTALGYADAASFWEGRDPERFQACRAEARRRFSKALASDMFEYSVESSPALLKVLEQNDLHTRRELRLNSIVHAAGHLRQRAINGEASSVRSQVESLRAKGWRPRSVVSYPPEDGALQHLMTWELPKPSVTDQISSSRRQANLALALLQLGDIAPVLPMLKEGDRTTRNLIVTRAPDSRVPLDVWLEIATTYPDCRFAALMACSGYPRPQQPGFSNRLANWYRTIGSARVHSAIRSLMSSWSLHEERQVLDQQLESTTPTAGDEWYVGPQGITFTVFEGPTTVIMGSPAHEFGRIGRNEILHRQQIPKSFAVSTTEISNDQFRSFRDIGPIKAPPDHPITSVSWFDAIAYCRWLSEQHGIPEDEMCFPPVDQIGPGMKLQLDYTLRTGFRLPTEAEWEYVCRADSRTAWHCGADETLLPHFANYRSAKSAGTLCRVDAKLPNDFGMFQTHGNVFEWCQDPIGIYNFTLGKRAWPNRQYIGTITASDERACRGGSFLTSSMSIRSSIRKESEVDARTTGGGFRVVRTLPIVDTALRSE